MADPPSTPPSRPLVRFSSPPEAPSKGTSGRSKPILKAYRELTPAPTINTGMLGPSLGSPFTSPVKARHPNSHTPDHPFLLNLIKEVDDMQAAKGMASQGSSGSPSHRPTPLNAPSANDDAEEVKERLRRANQFDMPTEPVDPSFFNDMVPLSDVNLNFNLPPHRPGSASTELFRTRPLPRPHHSAAVALPTGELQKTRSQPSSPFATQEAEEASPDDLYDPDYRQGPATKSSRGHPRTRFHNYPGSAGILRGQPRGTPQVRTPIVHHSALRTTNPDAQAISPAGNLAPELPSCNECPELWSTGASFNLFQSLEEYEEEGISHSPPLKPCSETERHGNEPYYVCSSCRIRAARHRRMHFTELSKQPRSLKLCDDCATFGLAAVAKPGDVEDGRLKKVGCSCGSEWKCFDCALLEMEIAKVDYETERDFRRGLVGVGVLDDKRCVWVGDSCICGDPLYGNEIAWRCTSCKGIGFTL
ncbi:MAG: hypothetical protein Q9188_000851 [Gyalolechia gomerana]